MYYKYRQRIMGFLLIMLVTLFDIICWVVFVTTNNFAATVDNEIDLGDDYELVKGLSQKQDPVDFRFTKFLDIRFEVGNNSSTDIADLIRSKMNRDPRGIQKNDTFSNNVIQQDRLEKQTHHNKYVLEQLEALTNTIQNMTILLSEINREMAGIRKNISLLSEDQISIYKGNNGRGSISISPIGVTYSRPYSKNELEKQKDNQTITLPRDCKEVKDRGNYISGVYEIQPKLSPKPFLVLCDMETRGGGWTHIQKRFDGSQDFYLGWREYKFGFGDLGGEFWLGLENIYFLTSAVSELLIELVNIDQETAYAHYRAFKIGPEPDGYPLSILTDFSGDAGDSLIYHAGQKFSTKDYDQDQDSGNCAEMYFGGWWYNSCLHSNLNGKYINLKVSEKYKYKGPCWYNFRSGHEYSLAKTRILVRQASV